VFVTEEIVPEAPVHPPNTTLSPAWNPLPLMLSVWFAVDPVMGFGLSDAITGGSGGAVT
jgi:hypothetical protein